MCPDRLSLVFYIIKGSLADAERTVPVRGCALLHAMAAVMDMALFVGLVTGLALAWVLYDVGSSILNSRRYREWKAARHAD